MKTSCMKNSLIFQNEIKFFSVLVVFNFLNLNSLAQDNSAPGIISGNIQAIGQYYQEDTLINAALPEHLYGFDGFANVNYQKGILELEFGMKVI